MNPLHFWIQSVKKKFLLFIFFQSKKKTGRSKIWNLVEKIKKNKTVLLTSHSIEECERLSDKAGKKKKCIKKKMCKKIMCKKNV